MSDDAPTSDWYDETPNPGASYVGSTLGNFRIDSELGSGAYGVVYKAWDLVAERYVALKMLRTDDADHRKTLLNEARKAARLRHENIVPILHVTPETETPFYIVMEYVDGTTLSRVIEKEAPLPNDAALIIMRDILSGLEHAHSNGIVHLDVKPANIILEKDSFNARIADFGMAMHHSERWSRSPGGTLVYMAPEQVRGNAAQCDGRTDIWAVGVILYEMLTGMRPFGANDYVHNNRIVQEILSVSPKPPSQWNARTSKSIDTICLKCLEKDVANRYGSVTRLLEDVEAAETAPIDPSATNPEQRDGELTAPATRSQFVVSGCLVAIGFVLIVMLVIFRVLDLHDAEVFLRKILRVF